MCFGRCRGALSGRREQTAATKGPSKAAQPRPRSPLSSAVPALTQRPSGAASAGGDLGMELPMEALPSCTSCPAPPGSGSAVPAEPTRPARCSSAAMEEPNCEGFPRSEHPLPGPESPARRCPEPRTRRGSPSPPPPLCPALAREGARGSRSIPRCQPRPRALRRRWWLWPGLTAGQAPPLSVFNSCLLPPPPAPTPARPGPASPQPRAPAPTGAKGTPGRRRRRAPEPPGLVQPPPGPGQPPEPRAPGRAGGARVKAAGLLSETPGVMAWKRRVPLAAV